MKYFGFKDVENLRQEFEIGKEEVQDEEVLLASYALFSYEGEAFVLFRRDDKLYEVNGGHCSCYGLEGQWRPEETSFAALLARPHLLLPSFEHDPKARELLRALAAEEVS